MNDDDQSRIHKLEQQLYSRDYTPEEDKRTEIKSEEVEGLQTNWAKAQSKEQAREPKRDIAPKKEGSFIKWILIVSVLFFLVSAVIAAFIFWRGGASISSRNVDVRILGPVSIGGGEELSLEIIVDNKNNVDMEAATVFVEYPEGTRVSENINEELLRDSQDYGPIGAGRNVRRTFKSVLFGEQESIKEIKVVVEYRVRGSSATFEKEKNYEIEISSSPVLVNIDYPGEVSSGQEVEFVIDIVSNSNTPLSDVLMRAEYPFGFVLSESDPSPAYDSDIFSIGELEPEEKVTITLRGVLQAQDNEERTFRFNVGTQSEADERELAAVYVASSETVRVAETSVGLSARINASQAQQIAARSGQNVSAVISWVNNLSTPIIDADLSASLRGTMLDRGSVSAGNGGFFRSSNDTISWDQNGQPTLGEILPGGKGTVSFNFDVEPLTQVRASSVRNPEIDIVIDISGTRFSEGNVPEEASAQIERVVRIASDLEFTARAVRTIGPIENSGPVPPRVDETTTYTVLWSLTNSYNDLENVRVVAQLPAYVEWEDIFSPASENIAFNSTTNQVVWDIDTVPAGAGFSVPAKEIAFRLAVTPSLSQLGSSPVIIQQASVSGQDAFAGIELSDSASSLSTDLSDDPGMTSDDAEVVE